MQTIDIWQYDNSELEEMGIPLQCECLSTYREVDRDNMVRDVCVDCDASVVVRPYR